MQTVSQAVEDLIYVTRTERSRATQIARSLIDAGILPKSSGRDIKKISAEQLLPLLASIAMADKVVDAPRIASEFMSLSLQTAGSAKVEELTASSNLPHIFAAIMEKRDIWMRAEIEFAKQASGYTANIRAELKKDDELSFELSLPFWRDESWGHWCKTSFTISAEGVEILRNLFARDYDQERERSAIVEVKVTKRRTNTAQNGPRQGTAEQGGQDAN